MPNGARDSESQQEPDGVVEHYDQWFVELAAGSREPVTRERALEVAMYADKLGHIVQAVYLTRTDYLVRRPIGERYSA